ncbi:MAG: glycosyltransferase [Agriterribacter sp.]
MIILPFISFALLIAYYFLINYYYNAWIKVPEFSPANTDANPGVKISVIVPARNEENVIEDCVLALLEQKYPEDLFEIIIVDDYSTDRTVDIIKGINPKRIKLLALKHYYSENEINAHKKKAIETGIQYCSGDLIITTDADCVADENWISTIAAFYKYNKAAFIVAPVKITIGNPPILSVFQSIDFAILQGITGASVFKRFHYMCNGANLAYEKKAFYAVNGFEGIDHIASGDDMLLMEKIAKKFPDGIAYLKSEAAIVSTLPSVNWKNFFNQRIRWASKTKDYIDKKIIAVLALVYLLNLSLFSLLAGCIINPSLLLFFVVFVFYKCIIEWRFVSTLLKYFKLHNFMFLFPLFQPLHIIYIVVSGFFGSIGKYRWKGRVVK